MALTNVARRPLTGKARQFDGSLTAFMDIIGVRPKTNLTVTLGFDDTGAFTRLQLSFAAGVSLVLGVGDWVVFPDNTAELPMVVDNAHAGSDWTAV